MYGTVVPIVGYLTRTPAINANTKGKTIDEYLHDHQGVGVQRDEVAADAMTTVVMSGAGVLSTIARDPDYRCPGCERIPAIYPCFPGCQMHKRRRQIIEARIAELSSGRNQ